MVVEGVCDEDDNVEMLEVVAANILFLPTPPITPVPISLDTESSVLLSNCIGKEEEEEEVPFVVFVVEGVSISRTASRPAAFASPRVGKFTEISWP